MSGVKVPLKVLEALRQFKDAGGPPTAAGIETFVRKSVVYELSVTTPDNTNHYHRTIEERLSFLETLGSKEIASAFSDLLTKFRNFEASRGILASNALGNGGSNNMSGFKEDAREILQSRWPNNVLVIDGILELAIPWSSEHQTLIDDKINSLDVQLVEAKSELNLLESEYRASQKTFAESQRAQQTAKSRLATAENTASEVVQRDPLEICKGASSRFWNSLTSYLSTSSEFEPRTHDHSPSSNEVTLFLKANLEPFADEDHTVIEIAVSLLDELSLEHSDECVKNCFTWLRAACSGEIATTATGFLTDAGIFDEAVAEAHRIITKANHQHLLNLEVVKQAVTDASAAHKAANAIYIEMSDQATEVNSRLQDQKRLVKFLTLGKSACSNARYAAIHPQLNRTSASEYVERASEQWKHEIGLKCTLSTLEKALEEPKVFDYAIDRSLAEFARDRQAAACEVCIRSGAGCRCDRSTENFRTYLVKVWNLSLADYQWLIETEANWSLGLLGKKTPLKRHEHLVDNFNVNLLRFNNLMNSLTLAPIARRLWEYELSFRDSKPDLAQICQEPEDLLVVLSETALSDQKLSKDHIVKLVEASGKSKKTIREDLWDFGLSLRKI